MLSLLLRETWNFRNTELHERAIVTAATGSWNPCSASPATVTHFPLTNWLLFKRTLFHLGYTTGFCNSQNPIQKLQAVLCSSIPNYSWLHISKGSLNPPGQCTNENMEELLSKPSTRRSKIFFSYNDQISVKTTHKISMHPTILTFINFCNKY